MLLYVIPIPYSHSQWHKLRVFVHVFDSMPRMRNHVSKHVHITMMFLIGSDHYKVENKLRNEIERGACISSKSYVVDSSNLVCCR